MNCRACAAEEGPNAGVRTGSTWRVTRVTEMVEGSAWFRDMSPKFRALPGPCRHMHTSVHGLAKLSACVALVPCTHETTASWSRCKQMRALVVQGLRVYLVIDPEVSLLLELRLGLDVDTL